MAVRVTWDVDNIFKYLVDAHPVLAELRDRIFVGGRPADQDDKIELGRLYEERLEAERTGVAERLVSALLPGAADAHVSRATGEKMAADVAFLVPRDGADAFRERVREAASAWPGEYAFSAAALAPFNFVELDITAVTPIGGGRMRLCAVLRHPRRLREVARQAEDASTTRTRPHAELKALYARFEAGEVSDEECDRREREVAARLALAEAYHRRRPRDAR